MLWFLFIKKLNSFVTLNEEMHCKPFRTVSSIDCTFNFPWKPPCYKERTPKAFLKNLTNVIVSANLNSSSITLFMLATHSNHCNVISMIRIMLGIVKSFEMIVLRSLVVLVAAAISWFRSMWTIWARDRFGAENRLDAVLVAELGEWENGWQRDTNDGKSWLQNEPVYYWYSSI